MRRYVSARGVPGKTTVTVSLVDGDLSAKWTATSYIGGIASATHAADRLASKALDEVRAALEPES